MGEEFTIWTGGGPWDPEIGRRAAAIAPLPDLEPLPRAAHLIFWWGRVRFHSLIVACTVRNTPWGDGQMTWLDFKGTQVTDGMPEGPAKSMRLLIPALYVTDIRPGPTYTATSRHNGRPIGLYPPSHPAPPHALPLAEVERRLAGLADAPADPRGFSLAYPLFALRQPDGEFVGFGPDRNRRQVGEGFGFVVFTTEAAAVRFLAHLDRHSGSRSGIVVEPFERVAVFRRFLRSIRDSGASVLFDPASGPDRFLFVDHAHPAAVLLERFLPQPAWCWSYPVYVLRAALPGLTLHTTVGHHADGRRWTILPVFTDADLADRAVDQAAKGAMPLAVPDAEAFAELLRELPAGYLVAFDHEPAHDRVGKVVMSRDDLLANLEDMEL